MVTAATRMAFAAAPSTHADYVRSILQCIDLRPARAVCRAYTSWRCGMRGSATGLLAFSDAAIIAFHSVELAEIAIATAETVRAVFGVEPLVALLSFSTKAARSIRKWIGDRGAAVYRERAPGLNVDGELQADAALVPAWAKPSRRVDVAGYANTLIFPDLNSANIGHKLCMPGGRPLLAVLLQGIVKPASVILAAARPRTPTIRRSYAVQLEAPSQPACCPSSWSIIRLRPEPGDHVSRRRNSVCSANGCWGWLGRPEDLVEPEPLRGRPAAGPRPDWVERCAPAR